MNSRRPHKEGTIQDLFTALTHEGPPLPQRFSDLKKELFTEQLVESWRDVLKELETITEEVAAKGTDNIPQVDYTSITNGLSEQQIKDVKKAGAIIVKGGVPKDEALAWKQVIRDYAKANSDKVKGIPPNDIVFYEIYNSKAQTSARAHPALINTQRTLMSLWHVSDPSTPISLNTPLTYFDRLRIRPPGPSVFTLGCHIDGGSVERWEDPGFRKCFSKILQGKWREHDPFDVSPRIDAKQDLYHAANACTIFRPWQGWTSLSTTGPREGTLRLLPFLHLSTAYLILRPFFRLRSESARRAGSIGNGETPLGFNDWEVNLDGTEFPGSEMGKAQVLNDKSHPHLRLDKTVTSIPRVEPGDQVYWHCDLVHAVESEHMGKGDSSVFYIPAVPLTVQNATYVRDQLIHFKRGLPAPDFPGGEGETNFKGRGTVEDVRTAEARRLFGMERFNVPDNTTPGESKVIQQANSILF
ncbi:hypothetical protein EW026_g3068 [Hermanssonia centrifuga]|uniref:DUF1479-domain-containing protein n=1 Tax=Hermanssonia centrifuga TaxID=98765 RepID=A0A4S4KMD3_9APHY|nr:hypothetical protein EW026_g3068 [Hermanssonia centrifuga]